MSSPAHHTSAARFLVLEGVDGSGKSTQAALLAGWLCERGVSALLTREPGGTALGERLRALILNPDTACAPRAELLMILAARAQHVAEVIVPALQAGTTVVCDRFSLSSLAYQGFGRGLPLEEIRAADHAATGGLRPDCTFVLDIGFQELLARVGARRDRFEGEGQAFLQRVIDGYRRLAEDNPTVRVIDGAQPVDDIQRAIRQEIMREA